MATFTPHISGSSGNAYTLTDGKTPLLLECGASIQRLRKMIGSLSNYRGILVTHEHKDHSKAAHDLARMGLDIYMTLGTARDLQLEGHRIHIIRAKEQFAIGSWNIMPFETIHDAIEPVGFLIVGSGEKILYATDSQYIPYRFQGLTKILIECNYSRGPLWDAVRGEETHPALARRVRWNHLGLETLLEMLRANDLTHVSEIHLLHLSDAHSDEHAFVDAVEKTTGIPTYVA